MHFKCAAFLYNISISLFLDAFLIIAGQKDILSKIIGGLCMDEDLCYFCGFPVQRNQYSFYYNGPFLVHTKCFDEMMNPQRPENSEADQ